MRIASEGQTQGDAAYWQSRIASLESIVCELLAANQRLRADLQDRGTEFSHGTKRSY